MPILESLGAILSGGVTGLVGTAITSYTDLKKQKLLLSHQVEMEKLSLEMMRLEAETKIKVIEVETEGKVDISESQALIESYKADRATYVTGEPGKVMSFMLGCIDVLRGSVRPVITYYFTVLISFMFFKFFWKYTSMEVTSEVIGGILDKIVLVVLYVGTTVVLWWFGSRNKLFKKEIG